MFGRASADFARFYRRSWWFVALIQLASGLLIAVPIALIAQAANLIVAAQGEALTDADDLSRFTLLLLLATIVVCLPLGLVGVSTTVRTVNDSLAGRARRARAAFGEGFRRIPVLTAAASITILGTVVLTVLAPLFTVVGVIALVLTPVVRLVRRRRDGFLRRWPDLVTLAWAIAPFGLALRFVAGAMLFAPAVVLERLGPIAALRAGAQAARPYRLRFVGFVVGGLLLSVALQMGSSWLGSFVGAAGGLLGQVVLQIFLVALPAVAVTVLFRLGRSVAADGSLPASRTLPYGSAASLPPSRRQVTVPAPGLVSRVAMLMPFVVVIAGIGFAPSAASAAPLVDIALSVNTAADSTDEASIVAQAANCAAGSGDCTLRAAVRAAQDAASGGTSGTIAITFDDSYTIALAAPITFAEARTGGEGGGEGAGSSGVLAIDGAGRTVVLDGQESSQVLAFQSSRWALQLSHLQISRGSVSGPDALGGGVNIISGASSSIDSVTFDHNVAAIGGGAVAVWGGALTVLNSTFASNRTGAASDGYLNGGADIYALTGAQVAINNSTFVGYSGASILNWAASGGSATSLNNSIFDLRGGTSIVACTGGGFSGSSNVVSGTDASCPGTISNAGPSVSELHSLPTGGPAVMTLVPAADNAAIASAGGGGVSCVTVDQRGLARAEVGCDAGAVALNPASSTSLVSSLASAVFGSDVTFTATVTLADGGVTVESGSMSFDIDGVTRTVPVTAGSAALTLDTLAAGTHTVVATYVPPDGALIAGSQSSALAQEIAKSGSTVTLSSSANPALSTGSAIVTATVTAQNPDVIPTGTLTLRDTTGGGIVGAVTPLVGGTASVEVSGLSPGRHTLVGSYSGDDGNLAADSAAFEQVVRVPSAVSSAASDTSLEYGHRLRVSVTVPRSGSLGSPTGTVTITVQGSTRTVTLDGTGSASTTITDTPVGSWTIGAVYSGDDRYAPSTATAIPITVATAPTATVLDVDADSIAYGVPVELTATVSRSDGYAPLGSVTFYSGSTALQTVALSPGTGSGSTAGYTPSASQLAVGSAILTAVFTPAYGYAASSSAPSTVTVGMAQAAVSVASDAATPPVGTAVTLSATVSGAGGSIAVPEGSVEFFSGSTSLGTSVISGGIATRTHTFDSVGSRSITAKYLGSGSFATADSAPLSLTVVPEGVVTLLSVTPGSSSVYGTALRLDVQVTGSQSGLPGAGSVVVRDGSTIVATIPLVGGAGTRSIVSPSAGAHAYQGTFEPSTSDFSRGVSDVVAYSVSAAATSTALSFSRPSSVHGDPITLTATVTSAAAIPTGSVTFTTGDTTLGSAAVVDGVAALTVGLPQSADFPDGQRAVVATFTPSGDFTGSSSSVLYAVARGTTSLSVALVGTKAGEAQSLVATVTTLTGTGSPAGTITFSGGTGASGTVTLVDGVATLTGVTLPAGSRLVQATYSSFDRDFAAPTQNPVVETVVVGQGTPTVTLSSDSADLVAYGTAVVLTATVGATGIAPTGTVRFTATGPAGSRELGTASVTAGAAVLSSRTIPVGTQTIVASYLGDANLVVVSSAGITQLVAQSATTTAVSSAPAPSKPGQQITLRAAVTAATGAVDGGSVEFLLGGQSLATVALVSGVATYDYTPTAVGELAVEARYSSSTGDFAASSGSSTHIVEGRGLAIYLYAATNSVSVGEPIRVRVQLVAEAGVVGAPATLPTGQVTVSDGAGVSCVVELGPIATPGMVGGVCDIRYTTAGLRSLTGSYAGNTLYSAATSEPIVVLASTRTTGLTLTSPGRWIPGSTATLNWSVVGPTAPDAAVTIRDGSTVVCSSTALSGSCAYTVPQTGAEVSLVLSYAGTNEWAYQSTVLTKAITACVLVGRLGVSPSNGGTVTVVTPPNCGTNGYLPDTAVELRASAADGFSFSRWNEPTQISSTVYVLAQTGGYVSDTAFFSRPCVEVTFTVLGGTRYGGQELESNAVPNCGAGWVRSDYRSQTGMFQVGTVIDLKAVVPATAPGTAAQKLYGWSGLAAGADQTSLRQSYTVTSELFQEVTASFGISCVHDIRVVQPADGTITLGGANCTDDIGLGYTLGSSIPISTRSTGDAYFSSWTGNIRPLTQTSNSASGTVTVYAKNPVIGANYSQCLSFSVTSTGYVYLGGGDGFFSGKATVTPTGNCPTRGAGWYVPGTRVSIDTTGERGTTFDGWKTDLPLQAMATTRKNSITLTTSGVANALWYAANQCKPYSVTAVQPQYTTVASSFSGGDQGCPDGQLNSALGGTSGQRITLTATATRGDPLLGWSGVSSRWKDSSLTTSQALTPTTDNPRTVGIASTGSFSAWTCQAISTTLTLISPNGTKNSTPLPSGTDFVGASPAPDCPIAASAYTLGQDVFPQALEQSSGYTFVGWSGAVNSTEPYPTTPIPIDGASKYIALTATYQVNCFTLTTNTQHTAVQTAPNCPNTPASENRYIGGTLITLQTIGNAGTKVFRGFTGDLDGQSGIYSWVSINKDSAIYSNYETRSAGEAIRDAFTDAANGTAIAAKKAVGVVAAAAAAFVMGDNPVLMVASLVVLLGTGVQAVADAFNLSSDGLKAFTGGINALSQTLTFMQSAATCATVWSASSGSSSTEAKDVNTTAMGAAGVVIANRVIEARDKAAALREAQRAAQSAAMAAAYDARLANQLLASSDEVLSTTTRVSNYVTSTVKTATDKVNKALDAAKGPLETVGRLGDVALVGYTIYSEYQNQSTGWDSSAESAWTTGGDVYMNCLMDAVPPYFGVPARQK